MAARDAGALTRKLHATRQALGRMAGMWAWRAWGRILSHPLGQAITGCAALVVLAGLLLDWHPMVVVVILWAYWAATMVLLWRLQRHANAGSRTPTPPHRRS